MGFDVTAAHVIFFIAALSAGSAAMGAYWHDASYIEDARRLEDNRAAERAHTNMTILSTSYAPGADRFSVNIKNGGSTVIDISELVYLVDGVVVASSSIESLSVEGAGSATDVWLPMETLKVRLSPITSSPTAFRIVDANGAAASWRS